MKTKIIAILLSALIVSLSFCACGDASKAEATYKPPAEVFDVKVSGTSEPKIEGVKFTYDSNARIDSVSFSVDGYDYTQEYSYDTEQIVIKTIYKTEVIEEKVIKYVDIPIDNGFTTIDGYFVKLNNTTTNKEEASNTTIENSTAPSSKKSSSLSDVLQSGYWIRYSPQYSGFDAFTFSENAVNRIQYSYENGVVTPSGNDHKDTYSINNNTITINDIYGSSEWEYNNGEMIYSWQDTLPDGSNTFYYDQIIFHHDDIPDYETALAEKSKSYK